MLQDVLKEYGAIPVSAMEVYTDIFKLGEGYIQKFNDQKRNVQANPLGYWKNKNSDTGHYRVLFEDTFEDTLKEMQQADFSIINGITYFGRRNTQQHASKMYAMIFDLDGVTDKTLNAFLSGAFADYTIYPIPNYIILSGHGVHLYYLFDYPVPLYPNIKLQLKSFKYALTEKMWNGYTSELDSPQYQGINQGFRVIGGKTKIEGVTVTAYRLNTHPYTLRQLGEYIQEDKRIDESKLYKESKITLQEAKTKYPLWYEKVVINKDKTITKWDIADKVNGANPYALYDWWKKQIEAGASYHHRYFAIMCLAIYGVKNGVPYDKVKKDAFSYIDFMNRIEPTQPFTKQDCISALECYDDRYCTFPIEDIAKITAIQIPKNKRNGRKQKTHLKIARATLEIMNEERGKALQGRPKGTGTKQAIIEQWQQNNPQGNISQCAKELGISRTTIYKYWDKEQGL